MPCISPQVHTNRSIEMLFGDAEHTPAPGDTANLNLASNFESRYGIAPTSMGRALYVRVHINWDDSNTFVYSTLPGQPAFDTGLWPAGSVIYIIIYPNSKISGKSGRGGYAGYITCPSTCSTSGHPGSIGVNGEAGGAGMYLQHDVTIEHNGDFIAGGGGGGGAGTSILAGSQTSGTGGGGGGGGMGFGSNSGGGFGGFVTCSDANQGQSGSTGTAFVGGKGGDNGATPLFPGVGEGGAQVTTWGTPGNDGGSGAFGGGGGSGGGIGAAGGDGGTATSSGYTCTHPGGTGGAGGKAIELNGHTVTWAVSGPTYGGVS